MKHPWDSVRLLCLLLCCAMLLPACTGRDHRRVDTLLTATIPASTTAPTSSTQALESTATEPANAPFGSELPEFGVTNSVPELAGLFVSAGIHWHRTARFIIWQDVEPSSPSQPNANNYDWTSSDRLVLAYQNAGANLQAMLSTHSTWASECYSDNEDVYSPKAEFLDDWERFVSAAVERYDFDGVDDMFGLLRPIRYWQMGNEAYNDGLPIETYVDILMRTRRAAQASYPDVQIIAAEVTDVPRFFDTLDPVELKVGELPFVASPTGNFLLGEVSAHANYDIFITHFNGPSRFVPITVWYWQTKLTEAGASSTLWGGDAASGPLLGQDPLGFRDDAIIARERTLLEMLVTGDPVTVAWFQREQAREAVRKSVSIVGSGVRHMYLTAASDWPTYPIPEWRYQGLISRTGEPRPAFFAYRLAIEKLGAAEEASSIDLGPGIWAFQWTTEGQVRYCLWADDADITDENEPTINIRLPVGSWTGVRLTTPPLTAGEMEGKVETRLVVDGYVEFTLTPTPVFVEELKITSVGNGR